MLVLIVILLAEIVFFSNGVKPPGEILPKAHLKHMKRDGHYRSSNGLIDWWSSVNERLLVGTGNILYGRETVTSQQEYFDLRRVPCMKRKRFSCKRSRAGCRKICCLMETLDILSGMIICYLHIGETEHCS